MVTTDFQNNDHCCTGCAGSYAKLCKL